MCLDQMGSSVFGADPARTTTVTEQHPTNVKHEGGGALDLTAVE